MKNKITVLLLVFLFSGAIYAQEKRNTKFIKFESSEKKQLQKAPELIRQHLKLSSADNLVLTKTKTDALGFTHQQYQQYFNGIKVEFGTYKVHAKSGTIKTMNGDLFSVGKVNISPSLSNDRALNKAIAHVGAQKYLWDSPEEAKIMDDYKKPAGELLILPAEVFKGNKARLVYKFDVYATMPLSRANIYVDAHSGEVVFQDAIIKHADRNLNERHALNNNYTEDDVLVTGNAATRYSGNRTIETSQSGGSYRLRETSRGSGIETYNMELRINYNSAIDFTDNDNNWTSAEHNNADKDNAALDAHWGAEMTYDYFYQTFNRNSFNDNGAKIRSYVHFDLVEYGYNNNDNAFWNGSVMTYGDGTSFSPLTSIDIAAHEIGHAVCSNTANLAYSYESGAMNEGFSDIWAACVEHFADPSKQIWLLGEEIGGPLRSLSNPNSEGQPDTYQGTYWYTGSGDNGGVHYNSGVLNHWFYILTVGKSGTNDNGDSYNVTGINIDKAAAIAYRLETEYLGSNSQYAHARTYGIQAAEDLYGAGSLEVIATTNAFYAVGIGSEYVQTCSLAAPSSFASNSINDNGFTLSWNSVSNAVSYSVTVGGATQTVSGTSYSASGLSPGTDYACSVVANCSANGSGVSANISVTTTGTPPLNYCDSNGNNATEEYISRIQLGTIDNATGNASNGYADYTAISTNLTQGDSETIIITPTWPGSTYNEGYSVWIDYNNDGDFSDSGEQVWTKAASQTTPVSGLFTVSTSATAGPKRMRVSLKYNGIPSSCETFNYGEVEDYTVVLQSAVPDTTAPVITLNGAATVNLNVGDVYSELGATAADDNDGDISSSIVVAGDVVDTNLADTYLVTYNVEDVAGNSAVEIVRTVIVSPVIDSTAPVITLIGAAIVNLNVGDVYAELGANANDNIDGDISSNIVVAGDIVDTNIADTYIVTYNVSDTAGNAATEVIRTVTVNAPSSGCSGGVSSFPYSESFENSLGAWSQEAGDNFNWSTRSGSTPSRNTGPSSANQGAYYVYMESSSPNYSNKRAILNSPCFDLVAESQANFSFKYHLYGASSMGSLVLEASNDEGNTWVSVWSASGNQGNSWQTANVNLDAYLGGALQLRFNGITGTTWRGDMAIDAINLSTSVSSCNSVALNIKFDNYPEETSWRVMNDMNQIVASGGTYGSQADGSTLNIDTGCFDSGCYTFEILDAYGDGICCSYGSGNYTLTNTSTGNVIISGGSFNSSESAEFCVSDSSVTSNFGLAVDQDVLEGVQFNLYPNPVKSELRISLSGAEASRFEILNLLGQVVLKGSYSETINVSKLDEGVYLLKLDVNTKTMIKRFVKK